MSQTEKRESKTQSDQPDYFTRSYGGAAKWLLGITKHDSGLLFAHHATVGGLTFMGTPRQRPYLHEESGEQWARLSTPGRFGYIQEIPFPKLKKFIEELPYYVFRPRYKADTIKETENGFTGEAHSFRLIRLSKKTLLRDPITGDSKEGDFVYSHQKLDIPAADALVLVRMTDVKTSKHGSRGHRMKSIGRIDPSLRKLPRDIKIGAMPVSIGGRADFDNDEEDW